MYDEYLYCCQISDFVFVNCLFAVPCYAQKYFYFISRLAPAALN